MLAEQLRSGGSRREGRGTRDLRGPRSRPARPRRLRRGAGQPAHPCWPGDPVGFPATDHTCDGGYNLARLCDPAVDAAVAAAAALTDPRWGETPAEPPHDVEDRRAVHRCRGARAAPSAARTGVLDGVAGRRRGTVRASRSSHGRHHHRPVTLPGGCSRPPACSPRLAAVAGDRHCWSARCPGCPARIRHATVLRAREVDRTADAADAGRRPSSSWTCPPNPVTGAR